MVQAHNLVVIVSVVALLLYLVMGFRVGGARGRFNVDAPATTGHPEFERHFRVHANTLEGLVMFLPGLWMFAVYWPDTIASALGLVWIVGRVIYMVSYVRDPKTRSLGFLTQAVTTLVLLIGAVVGAGLSLATTGAL